jgi:hypothetical protein
VENGVHRLQLLSRHFPDHVVRVSLTEWLA